jgi:hypothetical protein
MERVRFNPGRKKTHVKSPEGLSPSADSDAHKQVVSKRKAEKRNQKTGQFEKGHGGGPGRPKGGKVSQVRKAIWDAISYEELLDIIRALAAKAIDGDVAAAREILNRLYGKSPQSLDINNGPAVDPDERFL